MMAFLSPSPLRLSASRSSAAAPLLCRRPRPRLPSPLMTFSPSSNSSHSDAFTTPPDPSTAPSDTPVESLDASVRPVPVSELKSDLYAIVASTNRGFAASPSTRDRILSLLLELERASPPAAPADDVRLLTGRWRLLFTDALDVLSLGLLAPLAQVGQIFQNIYERPPEQASEFEFDVDNVVELEPAFAPVANAFLGQSLATIKVTARGKRRSETRIDITFVKTSFRQEKVVGFDLPQELPAATFALGRNVGYIETTFLDSDIRIARSPPVRRKEGNVFVLIREL